MVSKFRIAVLMDMAFSEFQKEMARGIQRFADKVDLEVVYLGIGQLDKNNLENMKQIQLLDFVTPEEFDGIIAITSVLVNQGGIDILREKISRLDSLPFISIGPSILNETQCLCDNISGVRELMNHLIHIHHYTRFAFVSGPFSNDEAHLRLETFLDILKENDIPFDERDIFEGQFIPPSGYQAVEYFLDDRKIKPEVIVCANDFMALGAWNALKERGICVPFDMAVTGFDDTQLSKALSHQFTTVNQAFDILGYKATEHIHRQILGENAFGDIVIPAELRVRSSCGCVDVEQRHSGNRKSETFEQLDDVKEFILSYFKPENSDKDPQLLFKTWSEIINKALEENHFVYALEVLIREIMVGLSKELLNKRSKVLINTLYSLLLEQGGQSVFAEHWRKTFYSLTLRILLDQLQDEMNRDDSIFIREKEFREIVKYCNARKFYLMQFLDYKNIHRGVRTLFSLTGDWSIEEESIQRWFPPRGSGSFVCNIVSDGIHSFAYTLINATIPDKDIYEYLRIRFNAIAKDLIGRKEIRSLNTELKKEIEERKQAEASLKDLLNDNQNLINVLAHDIKNPLSHIIYSLEILQDPNSTVKEKNLSYKMANESVMSCNRIIEDVLSLQRFKNTDITIDYYPVVLEDLCSQIYKEFKKKASLKSIQLVMKMAVKRDSFCTNLEIIRSILRNLLSNAVKFSPANTEISFSITLSGKSLEFMVCDQGPGFTEEDKEKLYTAFESLSARPTGAEKSTGLGLSLVKVLVSKLNGEISLKTQLGEGSCFTVVIPEGEN